MAEQAVASFLDKFRHIFPQSFPDRQGLHEMQSQALLDFLATAPHGCNKHIASYFRLSPSTISRFRSSKDPKLLVSGPQFETVVVNDEQDPEIGGSGYGEGVATSLQLQDSVTAVTAVTAVRARADLDRSNRSRPIRGRNRSRPISVEAEIGRGRLSRKELGGGAGPAMICPGCLLPWLKTNAENGRTPSLARTPITVRS